MHVSAVAHDALSASELCFHPIPLKINEQKELSSSFNLLLFKGLGSWQV
jgi:hypothetical protein